MPIKADKLHEALEAAGIPIFGVSGGGRIDFKPEATPEQQTAAEAILAAHDPAAIDAADTTLRNQILTTAQSAVGVSITALTAAQVRALFAIMLHQQGGINPDGTIKPLNRWAR